MHRTLILVSVLALGLTGCGDEESGEDPPGTDETSGGGESGGGESGGGESGGGESGGGGSGGGESGGGESGDGDEGDSPVVEGQNGTVRGTLRFVGTPPPPRRILITKDHEVCGEGQREIAEIDVQAGLLRDAVVYLDGELEGIPERTPEGGWSLHQEGCRFQPYIMHVARGATLTIVNDDAVAHNIHGYEIIGRARRDVFNFSQPTEGHSREQEIAPRRGEVIQLACDIHDFMAGWIFIPPNPVATVAADGTFVLENVPAGRRTIKVFHPILGTQESQVTVEAGGEVTADFEFRPASD